MREIMRKTDKALRLIEIGRKKGIDEAYFKWKDCVVKAKGKDWRQKAITKFSEWIEQK